MDKREEGSSEVSAVTPTEPPINKVKDKTKQLVATQTTSYSGPLPPAKELERYDKVVPGAANRIIKMAEGFAEHNQDMARQDKQLARRGQSFALLVVIAAFGVCVVALYLEQQLFATVFGTTTIGSLAYIFIKSERISPIIFERIFPIKSERISPD